MNDSLKERIASIRWLLPIALLSAAGGCMTEQTPSAEHIEAIHENFVSHLVIRALGGAEALTNLYSYSIAASGSRAIRGEGFSAGDDSQTSTQFSSLAVRDLAGDNLRIDRTTEDAFPVPNNREYSEIIAGQLGYLSGIDNLFGLPSRPMPSDRWAAVRKQHRLLNPHELIRSLVDHPEQAHFGGFVFGNEGLRIRVVVDNDTHPISLLVDALSGDIDQLITAENSYYHRDTTIEVIYTGWQPSGNGVRFPQAVTLLLGGDVVHVEERQMVLVNQPIDADWFDFPSGPPAEFNAELAARGELTHQFHQQFTAIGIPLSSVQTAIVPIELAPGVSLLAGSSHNSLVIEQDSRVIVAEAPLYEARSHAIISWVTDNIPGKPISHVISSHHHVDHAAGLRTFVAKGVKVFLGEASAQFFRRRIFGARSKIVSDDLDRNPRRAKIRKVGKVRHLRDSSRPVDIYHIDSSHSDDMLIVFLPEQRLLLTSDIFSPGSQNVDQWIIELDDALRTLSLEIDVIAGVHGGTATWQEFEAIVAGARARTSIVERAQ